jgi:hypothetical protein
MVCQSTNENPSFMMSDISINENLTNAEAIVTMDSENNNGCNSEIIDKDTNSNEELIQAIIEGEELPIGKVAFTKQNPFTNDIWVVFSEPFYLEGEEPGFLQPVWIIRIEEDLDWEAIDLEIDSVVTYLNNAICGQKALTFDASGSAYYLAFIADLGEILRKYNADGTIESLTHKNVYLRNYVVSPLGYVYMSGSSSGNNWLRMIELDGSLYEISDTWVSAILLGDNDELIYIKPTCASSQVSNWLFNPVSKTSTSLEQTKLGEGGGEAYSYICSVGDISKYNPLTKKYYLLQPKSGGPTSGLIEVDVANKTITKLNFNSSFSNYHELITDTIRVYFAANLNGVYGLYLKTIGDETDSGTFCMPDGSNIEIDEFSLLDDGTILFSGINFLNNSYIVGIVDPNNPDSIIEPDLNEEVIDLEPISFD